MAALGAASKAWRDVLVREVKVPEEVNSSLPITTYYDLIARVKDEALTLDEDNNYAHAYIQYKKFFGMAALVGKHGYYASPQFKSRKDGLVRDMGDAALRQLIVFECGRVHQPAPIAQKFLRV